MTFSPRRLWHDFREKLHEDRSAPHRAAAGAAIGMFFGLVPVIGLKTLLAVLLAWLVRGNKIVAAVAVQLHDLALPMMPLLYFMDNRLGHWLLGQPVPTGDVWYPRHLGDIQAVLGEAAPLLLGSAIVAAPVAVVTYVLVWWWLKTLGAHVPPVEALPGAE